MSITKPELTETLELENVQETLLTPLCARADQWDRQDAIIKDEAAKKLVDRLPYDFERIRKYPNTLTGCAIRASIMDRWIKEFLLANPTGSIGLFGVGLDTAFERNSQHGCATWFEFDFKDVVELRHKYFAPDPNRHTISGDIFDTSWIENVKSVSQGPWLFQAAGVLMYLHPEQVKALFALLSRHFPGSTFLFDGCSEFAKNNSHRWEATVRTTSAQYHWAINDPRKITGWNSGIQITDTEYMMDHHRHQWRLDTRLWSALLPRLRKAYHINRATISGTATS